MSNPRHPDMVFESIPHIHFMAGLVMLMSLLSHPWSTGKRGTTHPNKSRITLDVLTNTQKVDHITPVLRSLHWLPVCQRTDFKIVYKALNGSGPKYIQDLLVGSEPPDPSGHQDQVYFLFSESELNTKRQRSVFMLLTWGTNSQKPAGLKHAAV